MQDWLHSKFSVDGAAGNPIIGLHWFSNIKLTEGSSECIMQKSLLDVRAWASLLNLGLPRQRAKNEEKTDVVCKEIGKVLDVVFVMRVTAYPMCQPSLKLFDIKARLDVVYRKEG